MFKRVLAIATMAMLTTVSLSLIGPREVSSQDQAPFGGKADVTFAKELWSRMQGYTKWRMRSEVYPGNSPHGKFLRLYSNLVVVDGKPYFVVVKDNFGGADASLESVAKTPNRFLTAVTVMVQRESGYDSDNSNWFWVKYQPDGTVENNPGGVPLAGRVAKGMRKGCIACHSNAQGEDLYFSNDK